MTLTAEQIPARWSMTHLSHADRCLHSLYLLLKHGSTPSHYKTRGTAVHIFGEEMLWELVERGEPNLYSDIEGEDPLHAKAQVASMTEAMVDDLMRRHHIHLPQAEADRVREMAYHLAIGWRVNPEQVVAVEAKFVFDIGGRQVVGKVDVLLNEGGLLHVRDLKTSWVVPDQESFRQGFQLRLYAAAVMFGRPVEKEPCEVCNGSGFEPLYVIDGGQRIPQQALEPEHTIHDADSAPCENCGSRGYVEILGEPLGRDANRVRVTEDYPRYLNADGEVRSQSAEITRTEAHDFLVDLARLVDRVGQAVDEDEWPAVPGSHCGICPAWSECPLAEAVRVASFDPDGSKQKEDGGLESPEDAAEAVERWTFLQGLVKAEAKRIRAWIAERGPVPLGADQEVVLDVQTSQSTDHDALAVAAMSGQPFNLAEFRRERTSTVMKRRKRRAA